ncbi:hypothetical protein MTZ49_09360 [Entomomonas sp. E2T0]|uniref:hypothetical protein n=1 Tax=Entomomonas sp. E2T0 TaxID=2930213 RepID=UPI0022283882|nr:hypothetical protein [Entomomonas sp. E2T0]UYZ82819.1 hypothetical protein MTZ49_09360 [Entomomonas sp. E2T0]
MVKPSKKSKCALCGKKKLLRRSHTVYPNFLLKHLQRAFGGIRQYRISTNPDKVTQNPEVYDLLCSECEQKFSNYERYFAQNLFTTQCINTEQQIDKSIFQYDTEQLHKFACSIAWRAIKVYQLENEFNTLFEKYPFQKEIINRIESIWKSYLLGNRKDVQTHNLYMVFVSNFSDEQIKTSKNLTHSFLHYGLGMKLSESKQNEYTYIPIKNFNYRGTNTDAIRLEQIPERVFLIIKLAPIFIIANIGNNPITDNQWDLIKIQLCRGSLSRDSIQLSNDLLEYINYQALDWKNQYIKNEHFITQKSVDNFIRKDPRSKETKELFLKDLILHLNKLPIIKRKN